MPQSINVFVYTGIFFNICICSWNISLGLIIIIVGYEIFHGIVGEELLELAIELRGQNLVWREHQRGALQLLDHLGHREGLARPGDAQQHLCRLAIARAFRQLGNRGRLVARGLIFADQLEQLAAFRLAWAGGLVRDEILIGFGFFEPAPDYQFCHVTAYVVARRQCQGG